MNFDASLNIEKFNYPLPEERIAQFPVNPRDHSKLLIYKDQEIQEDRFFNIGKHLPNNATLIYNETKVIHARLNFKKSTGASIEVFCLEPVKPSAEVQTAFEKTSGVVWKCLVGNSKKWKGGKLSISVNNKDMEVKICAERIEQAADYSYIRFTWNPEQLTFSEVLSAFGDIPLPPYMRRKSNDEDKANYQTIYANSEGSVAAPTAGLHFTPEVLKTLSLKNIQSEEVTLHVGAGTFKPVTSSAISKHVMHAEEIHVTKSLVEKLINKCNDPIIAVGTTTLRTLESLYWHGVKLINNASASATINVQQWDPYQPELNDNIPVKLALNAIVEKMDNLNLDTISGHTQLIIVPGYEIKIPNILITNFHLPKSTLLLLVSAFIGQGWRDAYQYALENDFRFLSYGDSCLIFKSNQFE